MFRAGVNRREFVAHAVFTNPTDDSVGWDYGFQFRTTGDNEDLRIFVVSDGAWSLSVGTDTPEQTVAAVNLDTAPGATNTLDLIVEDFQTIFGINGEFAGVIALPELDPTGDVFASTGFFGELVVPDRTIELNEFAVYDVPSEEEEVEQSIGPGGVPARPIALLTGSCDDPGPVVEQLLEATYPVGEFAGQANAVVAETSFTRVPVVIDDLLAEPYAIEVIGSSGSQDGSIACGDIGGIIDEVGGLVIALPERNDSGYRGIAYLSGEEELDRTNISVFLVPESAAADVSAIAEDILDEVGAAPAETPPPPTPAAETVATPVQ